MLRAREEVRTLGRSSGDMPGKAGRAHHSGDNMSLTADTGKRTWEDFVAISR